MILSQKHRFVFIKGRKVAGTSMEVFLSELCGPQDIVTPVTPVDEQYRLLHGKGQAQNYGADQYQYEQYISKLKTLPADSFPDIVIPRGNYFNHMSYRKLLTRHGEIPADWTVFAIERCPYRKIISLANMHASFGVYRSNGVEMKSSLAELKRSIGALFADSSFASVRNIDRYRDKRGVVRADILRYETLDDDVKHLMERLEITDYPQLPHLKKGLLSDALDLTTVFTREQLDIVNREFRDEFSCFAYTMV